MQIAPRISVDSHVHFGKPVIQGTRVPVDVVLGKLAAGMSYEELIDDYDISREDILAVLDYASKSLAQEQIRAVS